MANTRVTLVSGTAEVKRREKDSMEEPRTVAAHYHITGGRGNPYRTRELDESVGAVDEEMVVASEGFATGNRGNVVYSKQLGTCTEQAVAVRDDIAEGSIASVPTVQPVKYVDGRCSCCPYGYHIDLDFLNFVKDVEHGSPLSHLKRIQRTKRKLRKSMEVMLHQQTHGDSATATLSATPPPDVVHSTEASRLIHMVQYEQTASHQVLKNIDSSVNAALASIDTGQPQRGLGQRYTSSDSDDSYSYSPVSPMSASSLSYQHQSRFGSSIPSNPPALPPRKSSLHYTYTQTNGDESSHLPTSLSTSGRTDSMSSLSSVSTVSSEQVGGMYTSHASGMLSHETATAEMKRMQHSTVATAMMTSETLAAAMATHFPEGKDKPESPSSPMSPDTIISKASLAAIRQAMAVSLQRMRDLEEQVKAIPILQVRISVLKEEKRLLALQLKAKSGMAPSSASVRSIGVSEDTVCTPDLASQFSATLFHYPVASSPFAPLSASPGSVKSPPPTLPKPGRVKTVGTGDRSVLEPYLLQPDLPTGYTITDNQVHTEIHTATHEKETILFDHSSLEHRRLGSINLTSSEDLMDSRGSHSPYLSAASLSSPHFTINTIQRSSPRPLTRSIGIGEGNVHDSSLQIHEKELRTVFIGGNSGLLGKRNVGVEVRPAVRSVGVSYSCDEAKPSMRSVGVNVTLDTSDMVTAFDFKGEEELRVALRGVLQRNVRSVGINCSFQPQVMDTGVQHESWSLHSVACGGDDCRIDVDIRQPVSQRSVGTLARPDACHKITTTHSDWVTDAGSCTDTVETYNKFCNTEVQRMSSAATNTQPSLQRSLETQTELRVMQELEMVRNTGTNTTPTVTLLASTNTDSVATTTTGVNTKASELTVENFDVQITYQNENAPKEFFPAGINTVEMASSRKHGLSMSKMECVDVSGEEVPSPSSPQRTLTMQEQIIKRGASQATAFLGSTSSGGSLSPTSSQTGSLFSEGGTVTRKVTESSFSASPVTSASAWNARSTIASAAGESGLAGRADSMPSPTGTQTGTSFSEGSSTVTRKVIETSFSSSPITSSRAWTERSAISSSAADGRSADRADSSSSTSSQTTFIRTVVGGSIGERSTTRTVTTTDQDGVTKTDTSTLPASQAGESTIFDSSSYSFGGRRILGEGSSYMERFGYGRPPDQTTVSNQHNNDTSTQQSFTETSRDVVESSAVQQSSMEPIIGKAVVQLPPAVEGFTFKQSSTEATLGKVGVQLPSAVMKLQSEDGGSRGSTAESVVVKKLSAGGTGSTMTESVVMKRSSAAGTGSATAESVVVKRSSAGGTGSAMAEGVVVKRSSAGGAGSRLTQHRHSDGEMIARHLTLGESGVFSGRRVGSVEDFMPDSIRRLMNIETSSDVSAETQQSSQKGVERIIKKTMKTVTTKRTSPDGKRVISVTRTVVNPDGTETTTTTSSNLDQNEDDDDLDYPQGQGLGKLSIGRFDLSKISDDDSCLEASPGDSQGSLDESEMGGGIKDSGYDEFSSASARAVSESRSMPGLSSDGMGSLERRQLKSILKKSRSADSANVGKGISFAESVVGGTGSSSEDDEEEEGESDDDSTTSYEEGSYDGREGEIIYQCQDDEAIAQGLPGAMMYDQNIRETYELSQDMSNACRVLANYLVDSTTIQTKELNANRAVVQEEWFRVSSHKLSSPHQVEDYLSSINEISPRLLEHIVNLVDSNGNAAIHYCVSHCNFDIVGLLLDTEVCDMGKPNKAGYTPTMLAALVHVQNDDHREIIRRLFVAGDINVQAAATGQTALMLATSHGRADMVKLLLEVGADCNVQDFDGSTALMCAAEHGHTPIMQLLLAQPGCDATLTDHENSTALSIAMEAGHKDIGVILYKHLNFSKPVSPVPCALKAVAAPTSSAAVADSSGVWHPRPHQVLASSLSDDCSLEETEV